MFNIKSLLASISYVPMTKIPFLTNNIPNIDGVGIASPVELFNALFTLSITIGAILAVVMFMYGGIQMITARDNAGTVGKGKKRMTNAIYGLLMLLSTYIVLNTINPQLTNLDLFQNFQKINPNN